jgi:hypothetical protein
VSLEPVLPSRKVDDAGALELLKADEVVGSQEGADGGHEASDLGGRSEVADDDWNGFAIGKEQASDAAVRGARSNAGRAVRLSFSRSRNDEAVQGRPWPPAPRQ